MRKDVGEAGDSGPHPARGVIAVTWRPRPPILKPSTEECSRHPARGAGGRAGEELSPVWFQVWDRATAQSPHLSANLEPKPQLVRAAPLYVGHVGTWRSSQPSNTGPTTLPTAPLAVLTATLTIWMILSPSATITLYPSLTASLSLHLRPLSLTLSLLLSASSPLPVSPHPHSPAPVFLTLSLSFFAPLTPNSLTPLSPHLSPTLSPCTLCPCQCPQRTLPVSPHSLCRSHCRNYTVVSPHLTRLSAMRSPCLVTCSHPPQCGLIVSPPALHISRHFPCLLLRALPPSPQLAPGFPIRSPCPTHSTLRCPALSPSLLSCLHLCLWGRFVPVCDSLWTALFLCVIFTGCNDLNWK